MDKKLLGKRINEARKRNGMTGEQLAEKCNINVTYLRQIEGGSKTPSLPMFVSLCNQLKTSASYLLRDSLDEAEAGGIAELSELWNSASPEQLAIVSSMVKNVLETIKK